MNKKTLNERTQKHSDGTKERWRDVPGYEGKYRISDKGRVKSINRITKDKNGICYKHNGRMLRPAKDSLGYLRVGLAKESKMGVFLVHHLVLFAFVGKRPKGMQARHFPDRNPANNRLNNLQWGTPKENGQDKKAHGTSKWHGLNRGENHGNSILTEEMVKWMRARYEKIGGPYRNIAREASKKFGVNIGSDYASVIIRRVGWSHV